MMGMKSKLFLAMQASGKYIDDADIDDVISEMRQEVECGADPEEVLYEEGFEPDYVFDLIDGM
jgi:hypothetical protein